MIEKILHSLHPFVWILERKRKNLHPEIWASSDYRTEYPMETKTSTRLGGSQGILGGSPGKGRKKGGKEEGKGGGAKRGGRDECNHAAWEGFLFNCLVRFIPQPICLLIEPGYLSRESVLEKSIGGERALPATQSAGFTLRSSSAQTLHS